MDTAVCPSCKVEIPFDPLYELPEEGELIQCCDCNAVAKVVPDGLIPADPSEVEKAIKERGNFI